MNSSILWERDPNGRTEFTLDTHTNVAKKMFRVSFVHHCMSLLKGKYEEENIEESKIPSW